MTAAPPPARAGLAEAVLAAEGAVDSALDTVLVRVVQAAFAGSAAVGPPELIGAALVEIVSLDALRPGSWFALGLARGYGPEVVAPGPLPPTAELGYRHQVGSLTALVDRSDAAGVVAAALASEPNLERLIGSPAAQRLGAPVLAVLVDEAPARVASLLTRATVAFVGWAALLAAVRRRAATLIGTGQEVAADALLGAAVQVLRFWAGLEEDLGDALAVEREAAEVALLRVVGRRRGGDFAGARRLLGAVPEELLTPDGRADAACERALVEAEVASVAGLRFPGGATDRTALGRRLERGRAHLDAALAASPDHPVAHLLYGVLALCRGDDAGVEVHLGIGGGPLLGAAASPDLGAAVGFRRAMAHLRPLEEAPGQDR